MQIALARCRVDKTRELVNPRSPSCSVLLLHCKRMFAVAAVTGRLSCIAHGFCMSHCTGYAVVPLIGSGLSRRNAARAPIAVLEMGGRLVPSFLHSLVHKMDLVPDETHRVLTFLYACAWTPWCMLAWRR